MSRWVILTAPAGNEESVLCAGESDQEALIYGGKIVEVPRNLLDPATMVTITRHGDDIGPAVSLAELLQC